MRLGPPPLIPLNPIHPDRTESYPRALGQAFVGKAYLQFPEVKVATPKEPVKASKEAPKEAPKPPKAEEEDLLDGNLRNLAKPSAQGARPPEAVKDRGGRGLGRLLDVTA